MGVDLSLGDALFTKTQQRVLGLFFGNPQRAFFVNEVIRLAEVGNGAAQRELRRLGAAELLCVSKVGNQKHYRANQQSPIFEELCALVRKTFGLADVLRRALSPFEERLVAAFVFGSVAKKTDTASSDIDLFIVSDELTYAELMEPLMRAEASLGRKVSPSIYGRVELQRKRQTSAFVRRVLDGAKIQVLGSSRALG